MTAPGDMSGSCDEARHAQKERGGTREPPSRLEVDVLVEDPRWRELGGVDALVAAAAAAVARHLAGAFEAPALAAVVLDDDRRLRDLNRGFRGRDKATNVLSFPAGKGAVAEDGLRDLGGIAIARETVLAEAAELGIDACHHLQHLVVHGLLHLAGYDHETDADAQRMEAAEIEILARIGVADPYAGSVPAGA
jgi:probable rRNA maturation factor